MNWWVTEVIQTHGPGYFIAWCMWVIMSIVLHELGHGVMAIRCGDRTPIQTGHMTWSPIVHMGVPSLVVFLLIGMAWGAMPVDRSRFRGRYDDAKVSFAGPMVNASLALITITAAAVMMTLVIRGVINTDSMPWFDQALDYILLGARLNVALFILNMLPIPPLDGSSILANFSPWFRSLRDHPQATGISLFLFAVVIMAGREYLWLAADTTVLAVLEQQLEWMAPS